MGKSFKSSRCLSAAIKKRPHLMKWAAPLPKLIRVKYPIVSLKAFAVPRILIDFNYPILQSFSTITDNCPENVPVYCAVPCRINANGRIGSYRLLC